MDQEKSKGPGGSTRGRLFLRKESLTPVSPQGQF